MALASWVRKNPSLTSHAVESKMHLAERTQVRLLAPLRRVVCLVQGQARRPYRVNEIIAVAIAAVGEKGDAGIVVRLSSGAAHYGACVTGIVLVVPALVGDTLDRIAVVVRRERL